jgi:hypothetical protein|tara:strand:+ start:139 stop:402 length:264 start_codon:yes stop_codon:yes gene_type:complete
MTKIIELHAKKLKEEVGTALNYDECFDLIEDAVNEALNQGQTLPIDSVSQQRELLKKWWRYFDEESVAVNCNDEEREEVITNFFNCG